MLRCASVLSHAKAHSFSHESGGDHNAQSWEVKGLVLADEQERARGSGPAVPGPELLPSVPSGICKSQRRDETCDQPVAVVLPVGAAELRAMAVVSRTPTSYSVEC